MSRYWVSISILSDMSIARVLLKEGLLCAVATEPVKDVIVEVRSLLRCLSVHMSPQIGFRGSGRF